MSFRVVEYVGRDGQSPFREWLDALAAPAAAKVVTTVARIEVGNLSSVKWFGGIGECRIDWGPGYRVYLGKDGNTLIVLLGGGTKKRQQADIDRAKATWADYKLRKAAATRSEARS